MNKNIRMEDLPVYQIEVDEEGNQGIRMISLVSDPAISVMGMYFSNDIEKEYSFKTIKEQQMIVGPAMIPDKKILRKDENDNYYYVYFTKDTIKKMVEKFVKENNNQSLNIDHSNKRVPGFIQSGWIVEDPTYDKSRFYGFNLPVGSYFIEVKIDDKEFWLSEVKEEGRYGFSVEGLMGQKLVQMESVLVIDAPKYIDELIDDLEDHELEDIIECFEDSYDDYPKAATENAKVALRWAEENGWGSCGTPVGKARANQLAKGESITRNTIARMAAFERHRQNSQKELGDGCGRLMWLCWGGDAGIEWASRKLKQIDKKEFEFKVTSDSVRSTNVKNVKYDTVSEELVIKFDDGSNYTYFKVPTKIYDNVLEGMAGTKTAGEWGPIGKFPSVGAAVHQYLIEGGFRFKKGDSISFNNIESKYEIIICKDCGHKWYLKEGGDDPYICHKCNMDNKDFKVGVPHYTADGKLYEGPTHKDSSGRLMTGEKHTEDSEYLYHQDELVELAKVGPKGGINKSKKAPKSDTPNKDPKGEGSAKGSASSQRGAVVPKSVEEILQKKSDEFNEKYKEKLGYGVTIGQLKTVYQRGVGAFNVSHSPAVKSSQQWALARVNAFLYIVKTGRPENAKYTGDNDLLPSKHPKSK